jgi:hypothetical protein
MCRAWASIWPGTPAPIECSPCTRASSTKPCSLSLTPARDREGNLEKAISLSRRTFRLPRQKAFRPVAIVPPVCVAAGDRDGALTRRARGFDACGHSLINVVRYNSRSCQLRNLITHWLVCAHNIMDFRNLLLLLYQRRNLWFVKPFSMGASSRDEYMTDFFVCCWGDGWPSFFRCCQLIGQAKYIRALAKLALGEDPVPYINPSWSRVSAECLLYECFCVVHMWRMKTFWNFHFPSVALERT